jgi:hypothetical protein
MRLTRPAASEPDRKDIVPATTNINPPGSMPWGSTWVPWRWRDTRVTPVLILIFIVFMYSNSLTSLVESVKAALTLVITTVLTAAAEELVRVAVLPS